MFEIMVQELDDLHDGDATLGENGLELPVEPERFGKLKALARLMSDSQPTTARSYRFRMDTLNGFITGSQRLTALNRLAEQLSGMSEFERILFEGAVQLLRSNPSQSWVPLNDCLHICQNLSNYELTLHVGNQEQRGRYAEEYELADKLVNLPPSAKSFLDYRRLGELLTDPTSDVYVRGHLVRNEGCQMPREPLVSKPGPQDHCALKLRLTSEAEPEGTWLKLPIYTEACDITTGAEYILALEKLRVRDISECRVTDCKSERFPMVERCVLLKSGVTNNDLVWMANNIGFGIAEMGQDASGPDLAMKAQKYRAALCYEDCTDPDLAVDILSNLGCYNFFQTSDPVAVAELLLMSSGAVDSDDRILLETIDLEAYGKKELADGGYMETEHGLIARNSQPFRYDYYEPPKEGQQFGGIG